jgi:hypothetical protein
VPHAVLKIERSKPANRLKQTYAAITISCGTMIKTHRPYGVLESNRSPARGTITQRARNAPVRQVRRSRRPRPIAKATTIGNVKVDVDYVPIWRPVLCEPTARVG